MSVATVLCECRHSPLTIARTHEAEPIRLDYLNVKLGLDVAEAHRNGPILHLPTMAGPLVVAYGTAELPELCRQSVDYVKAWVEGGLPGYLLPISGADHFTILEHLADPDGVLTQALMEMIA
jgi:arylformamidase